MGLCIIGKKTGHRLSGSYSTLHHTTRWLAFKYCGMPNNLGENGELVDSMVFYMHPFIDNKKISIDLLKGFFFSIQIAGKEFPNIL